METNIVTDNQKDSWNSFIIENNGSFLQSFEWGQLQEKLGNKVFYVREGDALALVIKNKLPIGSKSYLYIPYGPCFKNDKDLRAIFQKIKKIAKQEKAIFLRVEPQRDFDISIFRNVEISAIRLQPQKTLLLNLKPLEDEILQNLNKATRYSIRTANKKGVTVEFKDEYTPEFYKLLLKTASKSKFRPHTEDHYKRFFDVSNESFKVKMCLAKYKSDVISASIMIIFANRATYLHAASDKNFSALQAPTFLMWEQIKLSKNVGCKIFDFWGIDEKKWHGVTKFKKSFGGKAFEYPESKNIVFQKGWYAVYGVIKRIRP